MSFEIESAFQSARCKIIEAASIGVPIGELDMQAFGGRKAWNTETRPGRINARERAIRFLVRAAERAHEFRPELSPDHIEAALRSLALPLGYLHIDYRTGEWLSTTEAVKDRGEEVARAIAELAFTIRSVEQKNGEP